MNKTFESDRLFYRELLPSDDLGMFELDSNPAVQRYTGSKVVTSIDESRMIIAQIRQQYVDHRIGRWAVLSKETNEFLGWAGFKFHTSMNGYENVHDLGYRFLQQHWGKGYGYESAQAFVDFGFQEMRFDMICACADVANVASQKILEKCGMQFVNHFQDEGDLCKFYEMKNPAAGIRLPVG
jgi:ribosomal-protein-alanine N-acetyltransferase